MKQQFLDLNGLTELVTYLKKSITEQKEILPYASNKLFPSTGNVNTIYIDTATNSIYRWDSSNKKYEILAKAVKSVSISESTENGKITLTVDGNKTTVPIHGLGSAAYTNSSAYSPAGHTHTKAQVGLGNVDNTADANKSVKHAITANSATTAGTATNVSAGEGTADAARHVWFSDSATETKRAYSDKFKYNPVTNNLTVNVTGNAATASSVVWNNVTGKPSTYAPSAHNHDDSTITSLNASKLFGTIDIARLPHGALERCVIVADDTARFALTTAKIQLGDTVKVNKTQKMYFVIDDSKLNSEAGYAVYTAGTATSVPWSGVTGKPTAFTPSSHTHPYLSALSVSGKTITYTKGDGTTGTITTQDTWRGIQNNLTSTSTTDSLSAAQGKILKGLVDGKLSLSGGTMTGTAMITWPDSGNWSNSNKDVAFPVVRGGLSWIGQSDGIQLFAEETANDNLELILKFIDDNSNGLTIRNKDGTKTARISASGKISAASFIGNLSGTATSANAAPWSGITGKPSTYPPSSHTHSYLPLAGGTMTGALNFANGTWNVVGDDVAIGDMNVSGTLGVMGKNGNTAIKLVQYGASTTSGSAAPGVTWTCTGANASTISGTLSGTFSGNLSGTASSASSSTTSGSLSSAGTLDTVDKLNAFIEGGKVKYALMSAIDGLDGMIKNDGICISTPWSSTGYGHQFYINDNGYDLYHRFRNTTKVNNVDTTTWSSWKQILDSSNYNSYAPTKTGGGASGTWGISVTGNAATATKLATARSINGTNFDGSGNITTATWGTARNVTIGNTKKSVNGASDVAWSLSEIGAAAASHSHSYLPLSGGTLTGNLNLKPASGEGGEIHLDASTANRTENGIILDQQGGNFRIFGVPSADGTTKTGSGTPLVINPYSKTITGGYTLTGNLSGNASSASSVPWTGVTGRPSSMPASDVSAWAKASSKPSYSWGEITGKPSTFTPASHSHNYAGSSSAGGNANAAVKLATARKIGSASFDGTADITLSQMGLNVPVEITKANYLAKKKAGTLNANTYYNVIDEYDSANVINDSSVTANSAFSSTKSEKTYAKKSAIINTTLTASKWTGSSAPYTYVLPVSGATTSNIVEINYASNASSQAIEAYQNAMLADGGQTTNQITIKATEKPTVDIPITIVIRNDL